MIGHSILVAVLLIVIAMVAGSWARDLRRDRRLTHPLSTIAGLYGSALALYVAASAYWLSRGSVLGGGGRRGSACVDTAFPSGGGAGPGHTARAGASISAGGNIQACALHPSLAQWALFLLAKVPDIVLWGGVYAPLKALLPVPALAGAAPLSFARITRAGAVLDEEIKATV